MRFGIVSLQTKADLRQVLFDHDRLPSGKPIILEHYLKFVLLALAKQRMKAPPYAVLWNYLKPRRSFSPVAAKTEAAENRIVGEDRRRGSQGAAVAKIHFAGVIPGPTVMRLI